MHRERGRRRPDDNQFWRERSELRRQRAHLLDVSAVVAIVDL